MKIDDIYQIVKIKVNPKLTKDDFMKMVYDMRKKLKNMISMVSCALFVAKQMGVDPKEYLCSLNGRQVSDLGERRDKKIIPVSLTV